ncbi:MAG TPA: hypothetical protein ENM97_06440 [Moorella mulderi]|nr:hypothetical protein [Moorella mulderi]
MERNNIYQLLGLAYRARSLVWGYRAVKKAWERKKVFMVIMAEDTSTALKEKILSWGRREGIPVWIFGTKEELGRAIGKRPCGLLAFTHRDWAERLKGIKKPGGG